MFRYTDAGFGSSDADAKTGKAIFFKRFQNGLNALVPAGSSTIFDLQPSQFEIDIIMNNQQSLDRDVEAVQQGGNRRAAAVHVFHGFCKNYRNKIHGALSEDRP